MKKKVKIVEVTSELGAGTRGASLGVGALRAAAINVGVNFFNEFESIQLKNYNEFLFEETDTKNALRIESVEKVFVEVKNGVEEVLNNNQFPFILAGDHSTAAATIAGIMKSFPTKKLGVVWVDAHADLHSPFTSPSGNIHGMPLAIACGIDNLDSQKNELTEKERSHWKSLKAINPGQLNPKNIVFLGVRDTEEPEDFLIKKYGIKNYSVDEIKKRGGGIVTKELLENLEACDLIYVSFDVDCMDPDEVSHGTGTPVKNGIPVNEVTEILTHLAQSEKLVCIETVEVNPTLDEKKNKMAETTVVILDKVLKEIC